MHRKLIHKKLSRPIQVNHSLMDHPHMEIYVGEKISLEEENPNLQLQRRNDPPITEDFIASIILGEEIDKLNGCRQFIHDTCISESSTGYGTDIYPYLWIGNKNLISYRYE